MVNSGSGNRPDADIESVPHQDHGLTEDHAGQPGPNAGMSPRDAYGGISGDSSGVLSGDNSGSNSGGTFISCDWGTSNLRLRLLSRNPINVLAEVKCSDGIAQMRDALAANGEPDQSQVDQKFREVLSQLMQRLAAVMPEELSAQPIMISGMASSSIGWHEMAYGELPVMVNAKSLNSERLPPLAFEGKDFPITMISGLCSNDDVMRGEETELLGLLSQDNIKPHLDKCKVLLPGTHSKHVQIESGLMMGFTTFMTGELFALLQQHSVLKHTLPDMPGALGVLDETMFQSGVRQALSIGMPAGLFKVRSLNLLKGQTPEQNSEYLSGLLISSELLTIYDRKSPIIISAPEALLKRYLAALKLLEYEIIITSPLTHDLLAAAGQSLFIK